MWDGVVSLVLIFDFDGFEEGLLLWTMREGGG